jgi:hypothetical protein
VKRYRVSWSGVARRTFAVDRPSDALYVLWARYRDVVAPGLVTFDAAGDVTFPVLCAAEIEAADMHEAAADFRTRHDAFDISGGDVTVEEVRP